MSQPIPTPDNSNIPLVQGIDPAWNSVLQYIPEDKRGEAAPTIKEWHDKYSNSQQVAEQFSRFKDVDPTRLETAVSVYDALENQPQMVYETLQRHLGLTPQQAQEVVETAQETQEGQIDLSSHPDFQRMQQQLNTAAQILLAQRTEQQQLTEQQQADKEVADALSSLKEKYGEFPEDEIIMRMLHKNQDPETAFKEYTQFADDIRKRRPAPFILGGGGPIPREQVDVTKLDKNDTKSLVMQMLQNQEG